MSTRPTQVAILALSLALPLSCVQTAEQISVSCTVLLDQIDPHSSTDVSLYGPCTVQVAKVRYCSMSAA